MPRSGQDFSAIVALFFRLFLSDVAVLFEELSMHMEERGVGGWVCISRERIKTKNMFNKKQYTGKKKDRLDADS